MASDSNLDKIVADFIKVEDQNFALFNYVTEMNNQVEGLQESITKLRFDIKEAKVICFNCKKKQCTLSQNNPILADLLYQRTSLSKSSYGILINDVTQ